MDSNIYRRPGFLHRPWITGILYDRYALDTIMHCDAYVRVAPTYDYLAVYWNVGGRTLHALDLYVIEPDGLTELWAEPSPRGMDMLWTRVNAPWMARVHRTVLAMADKVEREGPWARVVVQTHYVPTRETDCEVAADRNKYVERAPRGTAKPEAATGTPIRPRGRPRKTKPDNGVETSETLTVVPTFKTLPDWL